MDKYWFDLNSETFLWKSDKKVLLYNTFFNQSLVFENNKDLNNIVELLQDIDNLYCIELTEAEINSKTIALFIQNTVSSKFGNVTKTKKEKTEFKGTMGNGEGVIELQTLNGNIHIEKR